MDKKLRTSFAAPLFVVIALLRIVKVIPIILGIRLGLNYGMSISYIVAQWVGLAVYIALAYVLLAKKRNNLLIFALGGALLTDILGLLSNFALTSLIGTLAFGFLFVYACASTDQTLIKADFSKFKAFGDKFYYIPALLNLVAFIMTYNAIVKEMPWFSLGDMIHMIKFMFPQFAMSGYMVLIVELFITVGVFFFAKWIKDPYVKPKAETNTDADVEYEEAYCSLAKHIVLCLFTGGIWFLIWVYRTTKYLNKAPMFEQQNPTYKLLLCMFVPFYQIYWFYKQGQRIDALTKHKNLNNSDMATLCLILGIFIPIVACILMQDRINTLCTSKTVVNQQKPEDSVSEQLKNYKELLDSGLITQEEFDTKKKQLLGL